MQRILEPEILEDRETRITAVDGSLVMVSWPGGMRLAVTLPRAVQPLAATSWPLRTSEAHPEAFSFQFRATLVLGEARLGHGATRA